MPRPRSVPTALPSSRFAFLSGIHPDLDQDLYQIDRQSTMHHPSSVYKRTDFHPMQQLDENILQTESSTTFSPFSNRDRLSSKLNRSELSKRGMHRDEEMDDYSRPTSTTTSCDFSHHSPNLDESAESIDYSPNTMDKAKYKIKSQAEKIKALEAQLQMLSSHSTLSSFDSKSHRRRTDAYEYDKSQENDECMLSKRIMSPEERLRMHKERKKNENKYKDHSGKWDEPDPLSTSSIVQNVKQKDDFVTRLRLDPQERRKYEEMEKRMAKAAKRIAYQDEIERARDTSPLVRRLSIEEEIKASITKRRKSKTSKQPKRQSLENRLGMSLEERREFEKKRALEAAQRVHRSELSSTSSSLSRKSSSHVLIKCQTCGSCESCEEDTDNPGIFYCEDCWVEYEHECDLNDDFDDKQTEDIRDDATLESHISDDPRLNIVKSSSSNRALWIVHDNPKLGTRLICSGTSKTACLIETKDPDNKNCTRLIHGMIEYSGPIVGSLGRGQRQIVATDRGTECIRLGQVQGYKVDHSQVELRLAKDKSVYEFQLDRESGIALTGPGATLTVNEFLNGCDGPVDIILDPQISPGDWYPIREASESLRKLAPQFRSKGVGYIRLGDDMGRNGLAFLSSDCCHTFLSSETVDSSGVNTELLKTVSSFSNKPGYHSRGNRQGKDEQTIVHDSSKSRLPSGPKVQSRSVKKAIMSRNIVMDSDDDGDENSLSSHLAAEDKIIGALDVLKDLQSMEMAQIKWKEKADLLIKLGKAVSYPQEKQHCEAALNYIQDVISAKNVNIHVLRSALVVVEKIGCALGRELPNFIAWKTIMIEVLKLLKNKQCGGGVREILQKLHGQCFTLSNSLTAISHVLGIGKSSNQKKLTSVTTKTAPPSTPQPSTKANNVEVIEWLAVTTESERKMEQDQLVSSMDDAQLSLLSNFFLSHESHRDARCRKNAMDGLLHTMLYGIDVLNMSLEEVESLCLELKTSNPRSWTRLMKSLRSALKKEDR